MLETITSRAGVVQTLSYLNGYLSGITDSFGKSLSISRNYSEILGVTFGSGGSASYSDDSNGRLSTVTNLDNTTLTYAYGDTASLTLRPENRRKQRPICDLGLRLNGARYVGAARGRGFGDVSQLCEQHWRDGYRCAWRSAYLYIHADWRCQSIYSDQRRSVPGMCGPCLDHI